MVVTSTHGTTLQNMAFYLDPSRKSQPYPQMKLVVSGNVFEWYEYDNFVPSYRPRISRVRQDNPFWEHNYRRTKRMLERYIRCNQDILDKFLSMTIHKNEQDLSVANGYFNDFVKRLRSYSNQFEYIAVPEFQERGAVHYHLLTNLPYTRKEKIEQIWRHGFCKIKKTYSIRNVARYMSKYMSKSFYSDPRYKGKKKFFKSGALRAPTELFNEKALAELSEHEHSLTKVYAQDIPCYSGTVRYVIYEKQNNNPTKTPFYANLDQQGFRPIIYDDVRAVTELSDL